MRYYECKIKLVNSIDTRSDEGRDLCDDLAVKCDDYCEKNMGKFCGCITYLRRTECVFIIGGNGSNKDFETETDNFWNLLGLEGEICKKKEVSAENVKKSLRNRCAVDTPDDIEEFMKIDALRYARLDEHIVSVENAVDLEEYANKIYMPDLAEEASRIAKSPLDRFIGHPVHYLIEGNDTERTITTIDNLVSALMKENRLESGRIIFIDEKLYCKCHGDLIEQAYDNISGGTVMISVNSSRKESEFADYSEKMIEDACRYALKHKNDTLTVFNLRRHDVKTEEKIAVHLKNEIMLVNFREKAVGLDDCKNYLTRLAEEKQIKVTDKLFERLDGSVDAYYINELDEIFNDHYNEYIRTNIFPAYASCARTERKIDEAEGEAADELAEMIGLDNVKSVISKTVSFFKLDKVYKEHGINIGNPARSMIFTGNPGTAKTTVARLVARIYRDNGLLPKGWLVEVGRSELVGKYVGWTAPTIKAAFKRAKGSVLFIDEAYSLVDDRDGLYGDEAINTIVQEMENNRDDTVVIFAGYPDKMEKFLNKNPGLRSRIAFHVDFPDYNENELLDILRLMLKNKSMQLTDEAAEKAMSIFKDAVKIHDFGNGRFVRNLLESAIMNMSQRLTEKDLSHISDTLLTTLEAEDITMPQMINAAENKQCRIGF
ncbi:ATPase family associated with various cellular activities (AAA) [Ruminococcus sp. YRD2003]|uniref:AAA family ATPase n=1 Tax=Ruminococcus sp. YRD2003 TaxID=1452313 RepID=UPI0008C22C95|nr:ATPase family associated with various cellular activities (AAA) [Ruminococcus flavefaciens]